MVKIVRLRRRARILPTIFSKWVYDDGGAEPGDEVLVETYDRKTVGIGIFDGVGAISVRLLSRYSVKPVKELIHENISKAYNLRRRLGWDSYRLINSDADDLPGLIIDVYRDTAVIQSGSMGFDKYLHIVAEILYKQEIARRTYVRNDQRSRREAGLEVWRDWIYGDGDTEIIIREEEAIFKVNIETGHKTGFFLDQRINRLEVRNYCRGNKALDLFSYTGGFGIHALLNGAEKVVFVEKDPTAVEYLDENIKLNNLDKEKYEIVNSDVYQHLETEEYRYGLITVDPNALIQSREETEAGIKRYTKLYTKAYSLLERGGVAFLSSCSYFLKQEKFLGIIRELQPTPKLLGMLRGASPDHPYRLDTPELQYLKALYIQKT